MRWRTLLSWKKKNARLRKSLADKHAWFTAAMINTVAPERMLIACSEPPRFLACAKGNATRRYWCLVTLKSVGLAPISSRNWVEKWNAE